MRTVFGETNSRSAISRNARCVWRYGSSRSSAGVRGGPPTGSRPLARGDDPAKLRDLVGQHTERRAVDQDVVDLAHEVTSSRLFGQGPVHLRKMQTDAHGEEGQHERQRHAGSHRLRELAVRLIRGRRCAPQAGPRRRRRGCTWRSRAARCSSISSSASSRCSPASTHRPRSIAKQRELGLADDE